MRRWFCHVSVSRESGRFSASRSEFLISRLVAMSLYLGNPVTCHCSSDHCSSAIVPQPLFLGYCFDFPIQELLQQSTIPTPRNTVLDFALSSSHLRNMNRTRVSMFEILPNTN